jgi:hypothetical protein
MVNVIENVYSMCPIRWIMHNTKYNPDVSFQQFTYCEVGVHRYCGPNIFSQNIGPQISGMATNSSASDIIHAMHPRRPFSCLAKWMSIVIKKTCPTNSLIECSLYHLIFTNVYQN